MSHSPVPPSPKPAPPPSPPPGARSPHPHSAAPDRASGATSPGPGGAGGSPGKSNLGRPGALQKTASDVSMASSHGSFRSSTVQQPEMQAAQDASGGGADNIKVVVRVRPLFPPEAAKGAANVVQVSEDGSAMKVVVPGPGGATMQRDFGFHACLGPDTSQGDVMALCGIQQLLDAALAGYHVTILAYGQTGSGKTHTMSGRDDAICDDAYAGDSEDGIVSRSVHYLFHQVNTRKDAKYSLKASYVEIYNENVFDLIHFKQKSLPVKWDATYGFYVQGLKVVPCGQSRTMMEVIRTGMKHRRVGSHQLNMESSRSHSIMTVYCDATPTDPNSYDYGTVRYGKLSFVDLAGSERVKDSKSEGVMLKETININKSLSVLGKVISTLAENDAAGTTAHVPYRDSKLTKLLMDSLGGSALTLMIACCSPSSLQVEETLSTLLYATRTKNIHNRPAVQYDPKEAQISLLRREMELLRQENGLLREQLRAGGTNSAAGGHGGSGAGARGGAASPSGGGGRGGTPPAGASPRAAGLDELAAADEFVSELRAHSSPQLAPRAGDALAGGGVAAAAGAALRLSLNEQELRAMRAGASGPPSPGAGAAPGAGGASSAGGEVLRRLKETQTLLVKFSEENGRLARENDRLRAGRNALSTEHATVLDEIDLLRSKLSQLEQSVLTAAGEGGAPGAPGAPGTPSTAATVDMKVLLASLGLGVDAVASSLPSAGARGPMGGLVVPDGGGGDGEGADDGGGGGGGGGFGSPALASPSGRLGPEGSFAFPGGERGGAAAAPAPGRSSSSSSSGGLGGAAAPLGPPASPPPPPRSPQRSPLGLGGVAPRWPASARPPGSGGGGGRHAAADASSSHDEIYVADESKLAVLFGPPAAGPAGPARPPSGPPGALASPAAAAAGGGGLFSKAVSIGGAGSAGAGGGAAAAAALGLAAGPHQQRPLPVTPGQAAAAAAPQAPRIGAGALSPARVRSPQQGRG